MVTEDFKRSLHMNISLFRLIVFKHQCQVLFLYVLINEINICTRYTCRRLKWSAVYACETSHLMYISDISHLYHLIAELDPASDPTGYFRTHSTKYNPPPSFVIASQQVTLSQFVLFFFSFPTGWAGWEVSGVWAIKGGTRGGLDTHHPVRVEPAEVGELWLG